MMAVAMAAQVVLGGIGANMKKKAARKEAARLRKIADAKSAYNKRIIQAKRMNAQEDLDFARIELAEKAALTIHKNNQINSAQNVSFGGGATVGGLLQTQQGLAKQNIADVNSASNRLDIQGNRINQDAAQQTELANINSAATNSNIEAQRAKTDGAFAEVLIGAVNTGVSKQ